MCVTILQGTADAGELEVISGRQCVRQIIRTEGLKGFYSGLSVNLVRGVGGALLLVGYDEVKKIVDVVFSKT
jgi:solute carrier family 25 (adenine nucleotide translocator) protein 4/5/6/31